MRKVKFLTDFRGRETNEVYYIKDSIVELEDSVALRLIEDKRAVLVDDYIEEMSQPDLEPAPKKRRK